MTNDEIYAIISESLIDVLGLDGVSIAAETVADDVDGWDSLNHIRVMLTIQKRLGMKFTTAEIGNLKNVGELAGMIARKVNSSGAPGKPR